MEEEEFGVAGGVGAEMLVGGESLSGGGKGLTEGHGINGEASDEKTLDQLFSRSSL